MENYRTVSEAYHRGRNSEEGASKEYWVSTVEIKKRDKNLEETKKSNALSRSNFEKATEVEGRM
jgi:hypothetical protein